MGVPVRPLKALLRCHVRIPLASAMMAASPARLISRQSQPQLCLTTCMRQIASPLLILSAVG